MYRKLTSLRWHTYLPADAGETFTSTLDLFFAGPFLFAAAETDRPSPSRQPRLLPLRPLPQEMAFAKTSLR